MYTDPYGRLSSDDRELAVGSKVTAYWARCGFCYQGKAEVVSLDRRSVTVALLESAGLRGDFPAGSQILIPCNPMNTGLSQECSSPDPFGLTFIGAGPARP